MGFGYKNRPRNVWISRAGTYGVESFNQLYAADGTTRYWTMTGSGMVTNNDFGKLNIPVNSVIERIIVRRGSGSTMTVESTIDLFNESTGVPVASVVLPAGSATPRFFAYPNAQVGGGVLVWRWVSPVDVGRVLALVSFTVEWFEIQ